MRRLTLALNHYDRHVPFFDGSVTIDGVDLSVLDVGENGPPGRHGALRHERMLRDLEFDAAELSLSSYLVARDGGAPFTAIPVFPRRLFTPSMIWRRRDSAVRRPQDLAGRRVGINSFQTTLSVLAKGDLQRSYGLSWREIRWVTATNEVMPLRLPPEAQVEAAPVGSEMTGLLEAGGIDALIVPHPPKAVLERPQTFTRLFPDAEAEERRYLDAHGYYPIMHLVAFRDEILAEAPELALATMAAFERAWDVCRRRWDDPNWSLLAWGRLHLEAERALARDGHPPQPDLWPNGIRRNRENLEWFTRQSHDQCLIRRVPGVEELFHPSTLDT